MNTNFSFEAVQRHVRVGSLTRTLCLLLAVLLPGVVIGGGSQVAITRASLEQWVETKQLISKTRSDWQTDKETIGQSTQLYERELQSIAEQMSRVVTNRTQVDVERDQALAEQKELTDAMDKVRELVAVLESKVAGLSPAFPPPLKEKIAPLLQRLPVDPAVTKLAALERLQTVVGILNEVDKFNAAVSVVSEVQKSPSGAEVQVETIYVGLGQAYFVDKPGEYAGAGVPTAKGWEWTEHKELAGRIRDSLAMYQNAKPAVFIRLPVEIR